MRSTVLNLTLTLLLLCAAQAPARHRHAPPPTPTTSYSTNFSSLSGWIVSSWGAYAPTNADTSLGLLRLTLSGPTGGEVQLAQAFGYGTYTWTLQAGSDSPTPGTPGRAYSGQVSAAFNFINNSQTEIDFEIEGQYPQRLELTNWSGLSSQEYTPFSLPFDPASGFHTYKFIWTSTQIQFYVDGTWIATHVHSIPTAPAYPMLNFYPTNSINWGGIATPNVVRWMYVRSFSFTTP